MTKEEFNKAWDEMQERDRLTAESLGIKVVGGDDPTEDALDQECVDIQSVWDRELTYEDRAAIEEEELPYNRPLTDIFK